MTVGNMSENYTPSIMYQRRKQLGDSDTVSPFQVPVASTSQNSIGNMSNNSSPTIYHRNKQGEQLRDSDTVFSFQTSTKANPTVSTSQHSNLGNMSKNSTPILYQRRKQIRDFDTDRPLQTSTKANPTNNSLSVISSEVPTLAANKTLVVDAEAAKNYEFLPFKNTIETASSRQSLGKEPGLVEDSRFNMIRDVDVCLANESCSSSKSNMDMCGASMKAKGDDTCECSSSEAFIQKSMRDDLSEKDIRILILKVLRSDGGPCRMRTHVSPEFPGSGNECSCLRQCKACDQSEFTLKMLICDQCEEAFHISCCYPRLRKLPLNEWLCYSCSKKKHKILKEMGRGRSAISKGTSGPIAAMLEDTEPYYTSVHIGLEYQAEVPDWSGPLTSEVHNFEEPLETSHSCSFQDGNSRKPSKISSICNWLQCQDIICGVGEGLDGTVCGKWRRAPLFEVQTDDWECFRCVLWDPAHADCAVPQEVDTSRVLKDLKFIQMLKPRLAAKTQTRLQ
uniref:PHD-type domain-containing protein n=2 Tax=Daucus carota subsp. sativus TaxID=79200 RepID=A0A162A9B9_DAUCS